MRTLVPVMAAALLILSIPAHAVDAPRTANDAARPDPAGVENQAQAPDQAADDDDIQLVIMGKTVQVQVPNPYKNPKPHLLTDAWAMRA